MNAMIVLRLDGEDGFLLVDPSSGTVRPIEPQEVPPLQTSSEAGKRYSGVAEAYALPAVPNIPSRKFYRH